MSVGLTYFAACVGLPIVKIGSSADRGRAWALRGPNGEPTVPILFINDFRLERRFHAAFEPLHIGGEWFRLEGTLLKAIRDIHIDAFDLESLPVTGWCVTKPYQTKASIGHWGNLPQYDCPESAAA